VGGQRTRWKWSDADVSAISVHLENGRSDEWIAKQLGATATAIRLVRKRRGLQSRTALLYSAQRVARLMGVSCAKTVARWIEEGYLRGRRGQRRGPNRQWYVTEDALLAFIADPAHWHRWEPGRITDEDTRAWATEIRAGVRFLTPGEVAERCFVGVGAVNDWIHKGLLPAVKWGNWWVRERDLEGFVPPGQRSRKGRALRRFTGAEDARLLELRAEGKSWPRIARLLGRSVGAVAQRHRRIADDEAVAA
jgi:hypothetical protein